MNALERIANHLEESERRPESRGYDLRLDLADLVLLGLKRKGWTQKQLAAAAKMKESFVTRVIHANSNCTFDVAGRLLFALGMPCKLDVPREAPVSDALEEMVARSKSYRTAATVDRSFEDLYNGGETKVAGQGKTQFRSYGSQSGATAGGHRADQNVVPV